MSKSKDSFTIIQTLMQEIHNKDELVKCIQAVLADQLSLDQAGPINCSCLFKLFAEICCSVLLVLSRI